jgi:hypothetical protein
MANKQETMEQRGNVGSWHRDRLPGLVLDIRYALEAFKAGVEAGEMTRFKDLSVKPWTRNEPP